MFCSIASFRMYYPKWEITATDEIICTKYVGSCKVLETSPLLLELTALFWPKSLEGKIWEEDWDSITLFGIYKVNAGKVKKKEKWGKKSWCITTLITKSQLATKRYSRATSILDIWELSRQISRRNTSHSRPQDGELRSIHLLCSFLCSIFLGQDSL